MPRHFNDAPGLCGQPEAGANQYRFNHTMVRIKDPERSLDSYTRGLGMRLIGRLDFEDMRFSLYFLGYLSEVDAASARRAPNRRPPCCARPCNAAGRCCSRHSPRSPV